MAILELIRRDGVDVASLAARLDAMGHDERVRCLYSVRRRDFARIFTAAAGYRRIDLDYAVAARVPALQSVRHVGINSLPLFRDFAKLMYRTSTGAAGRNSLMWSWVTGPGYFTVRAEEGELLLDYVELPEQHPLDWPPVRSNARGFSFFVFRGLVDRVRAISDHVTIGRAFRNGKPTRNYFFLVREP